MGAQHSRSDVYKIWVEMIQFYALYIHQPVTFNGITMRRGVQRGCGPTTQEKRYRPYSVQEPLNNENTTKHLFAMPATLSS